MARDPHAASQSSSLQSERRRQRKHRRRKLSELTPEELREREHRAEQERERRRRALQNAAAHSVSVTIPFKDWCRIRGFSYSTGRRLLAAGRVQVRHLSKRLLGVTSEADAAFLASSPEA
jgi:hypothetical protein